MKKSLLVLSALLCGAFNAHAYKYKVSSADSLVNYVILGESRMFMCPFLSPKFMDVLKQECQCEVVKTKDYTILLNNSMSLDYDRVLNKAEELGYKKSMIKIELVD